jgi:hypothetical protein
MTKLVKEWVNGTTPNYGMFRVGNDESEPGDSNEVCYADLSNISLKVTVNTAF